jgi:hypothetical protein
MREKIIFISNKSNERERMVTSMIVCESYSDFMEKLF